MIEAGILTPCQKADSMFVQRCQVPGRQALTNHMPQRTPDPISEIQNHTTNPSSACIGGRKAKGVPITLWTRPWKSSGSASPREHRELQAQQGLGFPTAPVPPTPPVGPFGPIKVSRRKGGLFKCGQSVPGMNGRERLRRAESCYSPGAGSHAGPALGGAGSLAWAPVSPFIHRRVSNPGIVRWVY